MREIKFRAWDEGKMLTMPLSTHFGLGRFFIFLSEHATLMQYTGLKDRNDKEIYEGDILSVSVTKRGDHLKSDIIGEVVMFGDYFSVNVSYQPRVSKFTGEDDTVAEIIGNIHENPELLEKQVKLETV